MKKLIFVLLVALLTACANRKDTMEDLNVYFNNTFGKLDKDLSVFETDLGERKGFLIVNYLEDQEVGHYTFHAFDPSKDHLEVYYDGDYYLSLNIVKEVGAEVYRNFGDGLEKEVSLLNPIYHYELTELDHEGGMVPLTGRGNSKIYLYGIELEEVVIKTASGDIKMNGVLLKEGKPANLKTLLNSKAK